MRNRAAVFVVVICVVVAQEVLAGILDFDAETIVTRKYKRSKSEPGDGKLLNMLIGPLLKMFFSGGGGGGKESPSANILAGDTENGKKGETDDGFGDLFGTIVSMFLG